MLKKLNSETKGFTIIEVLIVLAIAGLIMLIVFLAVPALQRNSRNTQRRNDVQKILGIMQEAANNNNGILPSGATAPGVVTNEQYSQYVMPGGLNYNIITSGSATLPASVDLNTVIIRNNLKCTGNTSTGNGTAATTIGNASTNVATATGATLRTYVAIFAVEQQGSTVQSQCVSL